MAKEFLIIIFSAILVDNFVLSKFMGICSFLGVSKNIKTAMGMSGAVVCVMLVASAITWPIQHLLLNPLKLGIMKKSMPPLHKALGIYLPLITTNCAVLGVTILNINSNYTFAESMVNALGAGIGFTLSLFLFSGVRSRIDKADVPESLKGLPITLISASLVAVSFLGFKGLVENLFGG